jgi:AraC-like DNA-binding protein
VLASNTTWIVPSLRAVWIPPDVEHQVTMLGDVQLRTVYVAQEAAPKSLSRCTVFEVNDLLRALIEALRTNPSDETAYADRRRKQLSQLILTELVQVSALPLGLPMPLDRRLQTLCKALTMDPGSTATLEDWAEVVGASSRTLARLFEQELGMGFGEWRQQLRLAAAIDLMGKRVPLNEVASKLGYANPAAFTVMFKRAFGVSPSQFRKN